MRILLDECVPRRLSYELPGHDVRTVAQQGWTGVKNGALLRLAAEEFDVFLTVDTNLPYQQNQASLPLAVIVLVAHSNAIDALRPLMPKVFAILPQVKSGQLHQIED